MSTESSSDIKVNYKSANGDNLLEDRTNDKKIQSTDTDYYFNMIANPSKTVKINKVSDSETSELNQLLNDTDTSESSRKSNRKSSSESSKKSSIRSHEKNTSNLSSEKKSSESREKYEKISISPKQFTQSEIPEKNKYRSNNSETPTVIKVEEKKELTQQEIRLRKIEMLRKLSEIKAKGFELSKDYDFNSMLEEMEYEYDLLKSFADKRNGVKLFRGGILQAVSVIEFLNDKYDPFDFHLSGWGDHLSVEIDSWENVLEEIYEKYKGTGKQMAPEIKLLYLVIVSASAFHFTKSQSSSLPGLDSVLAANPGLLSKVINPGKKESSQFMTQQEINIEKQREKLKKEELEAKQRERDQQQQYINQLQSQIQIQQQQINNFQTEPQAANSKPPIINNTRLPQTIPASQFRSVMPDVRAPNQVKDILSRIHQLQPSNIKNDITEKQDETTSNNDRLVSETNLSESNSKKRPGRKPKQGISLFT
jgi:hypothetical protein